MCTAEELAFKALMKDMLKPYVPDYKGQITSEEGDCILYKQRQKLAFHFLCRILARLLSACVCV